MSINVRSTHTYVTLAVSNAAFKEIIEKLRAASYSHAFIENRDNGVDVDMHGIALVTDCDHNWDKGSNPHPPYICFLCGTELMK